MKFKALGTALLLTAMAQAQMSTGTGTTMVLDAGTGLRVNAPLVWQIPAGASVINNGSVVLGSDASLSESPGAAITGDGTERIQLPLAAPPTALDAGGLGGILTTTLAPGPTTFIRGHLPYTDYSGHVSIARWIHVLPAVNSGLNATFSLRYDENELNAVPELAQILHIRAEDNIWWTLPAAVNATNNTVTTTGLDSLGLFTTFDQDLPNAVVEPTGPGVFMVGMDPDGAPWLRVPAGQQVRSLEFFDNTGRCIASSAMTLEAGWHPIGSMHIAHGSYVLRVNRSTSIPVLCP